MMKGLVSTVCGVVIMGMVALPAVAEKDDPMEKAVKARQGFMQMNAFNMGMLAGMAKGEVAYDAATAGMAAKNLQLASMMKNKAMWPQGSGNDNPKLKTEALPAIWAEGSDIGNKVKAFGMAAEELAAVADQGLDQMKPKFAAVGKACKGCHEDYRAKKK